MTDDQVLVARTQPLQFLQGRRGTEVRVLKVKIGRTDQPGPHPPVGLGHGHFNSGRERALIQAGLVETAQALRQDLDKGLRVGPELPIDRAAARQRLGEQPGPGARRLPGQLTAPACHVSAHLSGNLHSASMPEYDETK
jgi:hypothetical protein